jgi:ABC-type glycerol-3-phosphate transport system substrate-binding protein
MLKVWKFSLLTILTLFVLAACSNGEDETSGSEGGNDDGEITLEYSSKSFK